MSGGEPYLPAIRFVGQIRKDDHVIDVAFDAEVDHSGVLALRFDTLPVSKETFYLGGSGSDGTVEWAVLEAAAATGETIRSASFFVTKQQRKTSDTEATVTFEGACSEAVIARPLEAPVTFSQLHFQFPRFRSFSWLHCDTDLGVARMGGSEADPARPQYLCGLLAMQCQGVASDTWFGEAHDRLTHILRVMSFASGVYLRPVVERRVVADQDQFTIIRRTSASEPFYAPFVFLNLEPIFEHACNGDADARVKFATTDPAVRWLLAPGYYDEMRLMAAMTALEHLVEEAFPAAESLFLKPKAFKKVASAVRELLRDLKAPEGMLAKAPELNRQSFADKLQRYFDARGVTLGDLDAEGIKALINARNHVVHRGVYYDPTQAQQARLWDHLLLAREMVTRALLGELGFVGNYFSPLYGSNQQLRFPSCRRLTDDQHREIVEDDSGPAPADQSSSSV